MTERLTDGQTATGTPVVWESVPQRNKNFTGREELLEELHQRVTGKVTAVLAHALHGMGGVGKTQLAIEYIYRYMSRYEVVWWIPADQLPLVRSSLAALAPKLGLGEVAPRRVEDAISAVLDALRLGVPYRNWLIVFDNADRLDEIARLIPRGPGHVIVTSRNHRWESVADTVEVDVFSRDESLKFLSRRVPGIAPADANRLAQELGDLPLALEQAGALQVESGMSVDEYLELLGEAANKVLAESRPADYPVPVAAAWSLSVARLRDQMPFALELLRRLAFFGPEPIHRDLLKNGRYVLGPPLQTGLGDPLQLSRAIRELGRYALARVDNNRHTLQVHRLIQRLIRDDLDEKQAEAAEHDVHLLLASFDPDDPERIDNWERYDELLAHVRPSGALSCEDPDTRRLIRNVARYLYDFGDFATCQDLIDEALGQWTAESGPDDPDVLMLTVLWAVLAQAQGRHEQVYELRRKTLSHMNRVLGEKHESTLLLRLGLGVDLRTAGEFADALMSDEATLAAHTEVYGDDHPRTFVVANNVAVDQGLVSDYEGALRTDRRTHEDRLNFYGRNDHPLVIHSLGAIGRDLRQAGRYREALEIQQQAYESFTDLVRQGTIASNHPLVLQQAKELSVVRRKMGELEPAVALAEDVFQRFSATFGERHPDTLAAAMNLGNARRVHGELTGNDELKAEADRQIETAFNQFGEVYSREHPYTWGCALNLAIVRRRLGQPDAARELLEEALTNLESRLGKRHHYTLICQTALATSVADLGGSGLARARSLGEEALASLRDLVGPDHPHALACAANLSIDLVADGEPKAGEDLRRETLDTYQAILPPDHFDVRDAERGERIALDFEPPAL